MHLGHLDVERHRHRLGAERHPDEEHHRLGVEHLLQDEGHLGDPFPEKEQKGYCPDERLGEECPFPDWQQKGCFQGAECRVLQAQQVRQPLELLVLRLLELLERLGLLLVRPVLVQPAQQGSLPRTERLVQGPWHLVQLEQRPVLLEQPGQPQQLVLQVQLPVRQQQALGPQLLELR